MDACLPAVYRPRRPRDSPLYKLVEDQFETLLRVHEEHFQPRYGRLRHAARRAVEKFLDCGILEQGFARVRCDRCRAEFLVAFSCKARILCPCCHAKKLEIWADWLEHELLYAVPHRQFVFTVPKRLSLVQQARQHQSHHRPWMGEKRVKGLLSGHVRSLLTRSPRTRRYFNSTTRRASTNDPATIRQK